MEIKDKLRIIKDNIHSGEKIVESMDELQRIVEENYEDPEQRDMMVKIVINTKQNLLGSHPIKTFDETYLLVIQHLAYLGKI